MNTSGPSIKIDELYKLLIDQSPFQVTFFDLDLNMLYLNKFACDFLGLPLEEIKGRSILDFLVPEAEEPLLTLLKKINFQNPVMTLENRNVTVDGKDCWYLWYDRGIFDNDGKLIGYQSIGQDITKKKEIESDLRYSRERLKAAQEIGKIGDWMWDVDSDTTIWSDQTYRLIGLEPGEEKATQKLYKSFILPEYMEELKIQQQHLYKQKAGEFDFEYPLLVNNRIQWIKDRGRINYENDTPSKIIGTILDITESKELQLSLEEHIAVEETLLEISNIFMQAEEEKTGTAINDTMEILGMKFNADRTYLVLSDTDENELYQWVSTEMDSDIPKWSGKDDKTPRLLEMLDGGQEVSIPSMKSGQMPQIKDHKWFIKHGIMAFIAVPLYRSNIKFGYLCMDSKSFKPKWKDIDLGILKIAGEMCVNAGETIKSRIEIEHEKELLSVTLMSIGDGFLLLAPDGRIEMINNSAVDMLGLGTEDVHGKTLNHTVQIRNTVDDEIITFETLLKQVKIKREYREARYAHPDGADRTISYSCTAIPGVRKTDEAIAVIFRDVTEEKKKQREIAYLSLHDSLTGLYNRAFMDTELKRMNTPRQLPLSIITGDVNGLKLVNDVFGHEEGDKLLKTISEILLNCCREEDVISRWGGDEFSIILPRTNQKIADKICERIRKGCEAPDDTRIIPSIALGTATKTDADEDINIILKEAEDRMYRQKLLDDRSVRSDIISSLKNSMFEKSYETEAHTKRMLKITEKFGKALNLSLNLQSDLNLLAIMHDMGKIAVASSILGKTEKLTDEDWEEIKRHPEAGYRIAQSSQELTSISDFILSHHERWDGKGYPRGLKGLEIPEPARIISIVDTYDVMTNGRVYKPGVSSEIALNEIEKCAGSQFDPDFAAKFVAMMRGQL